MQSVINHLFKDFIRPNDADNFALTHNPMYAGSAMLKIVLDAQTAGLSLANWHLSIFVVAHLYNALRRLNLLEAQREVMDKIIELHKKAIFADVIPTRTVDMCDRLSFRLNANNTQKRWVEDEKWKMKSVPAAETLELMLNRDVLKQARGIWQVEQRFEASDQKIGSKTKANGTSKPTRTKMVLTSTNCIPSTRKTLTSTNYIPSTRKTLDAMLDDASIDYIRLTKRCYKLLDDFRKFWNIEIEAQGLHDEIRYESDTQGTTKDFGLLRMCHDAFEEAKAVRAMGIYSYRAGDGEEKAVKGTMLEEEDPFRHGMGLMTAAKVFKRFIATETNDFRFPLGRININAMEEGGQLTGSSAQTHRRVHDVPTAAVLDTLLSSNTYLLLNLWTDYDRTHTQMSPFFAMLAKYYSEPGVLVFARSNADDMRDRAVKYCQWNDEQSFVAFKNGKQVAVNGERVIRGEQRKKLTAAVEKLGSLAKKKVAGG
jgi:hypothetical protein